MRGWIVAGAGGLGLAMAVGATASDGPICWVASVRTDLSGVRVSFRQDGGPQMVELNGTLQQQGSTVVARPGDKLRASNSHHDGCELTVVEKDGRLGLRAEAFLALPGLPPNRTSQFIPAADQ